jgi:hypothetical protein
MNSASQPCTSYVRSAQGAEARRSWWLSIDFSRLITLDSIPSLCKGAAYSQTPGDAWAEKARQHVLLTAHVPTTQNLVVSIPRFYLSHGTK